MFSWFSKLSSSSPSVFLCSLGGAGGEKEEGALFISAHLCAGCPCSMGLAGVESGL